MKRPAAAQTAMKAETKGVKRPAAAQKAMKAKAETKGFKRPAAAQKAMKAEKAMKKPSVEVETAKSDDSAVDWSPVEFAEMSGAEIYFAELAHQRRLEEIRERHRRHFLAELAKGVDEV